MYSKVRKEQVLKEFSEVKSQHCQIHLKGLQSRCSCCFVSNQGHEKRAQSKHQTHIHKHVTFTHQLTSTHSPLEGNYRASTQWARMFVLSHSNKKSVDVNLRQSNLATTWKKQELKAAHTETRKFKPCINSAGILGWSIKCPETLMQI